MSKTKNHHCALKHHRLANEGLLDKNNICIGLAFFCLHCGPKARETTAYNEQFTRFFRC